MTPTRFPRRSPAAPVSTAAAARQPVGSTTSFIRSAKKRIVSRSAASGTVTMASVTCWTSGKVRRPRLGVRAPSAIVGGSWTVWSVPVSNDRLASSAASGSTPITRHDGATARATNPHPESNPPPPTGTTSASSGPASSNNSSATVPCPAITSAWS